MRQTYDYLKSYMRSNYVGAVEIARNNLFCPVSPTDTQTAELKVNVGLPFQLKNFYAEIGFGYLTTPHNPPKEYECSDRNLILPPHVAGQFYNLVMEHHKKPEDSRMSLNVLLDLNQFYQTYEKYAINVEALELLQPGDLPFFEIGDSASFMTMKLNSDNPNAVWFMGHEKIEDSLEKFIWNLYYDDPSYYSRNW